MPCSAGFPGKFLATRFLLKKRPELRKRSQRAHRAADGSALGFFSAPGSMVDAGAHNLGSKDGLPSGRPPHHSAPRHAVQLSRATTDLDFLAHAFGVPGRRPGARGTYVETRYSWPRVLCGSAQVPELFVSHLPCLFPGSSMHPSGAFVASPGPQRLLCCGELAALGPNRWGKQRCASSLSLTVEAPRYIGMRNS